MSTATLRARLLGLLSASLLLAGCGGGPPDRPPEASPTPSRSAAVGTRAPVDTTDHVALFAPDWGQDAFDRSDAQWEEAARTHDVLIGFGTTYPDRIPRLREVNPDLRVLWYNLGPYLLRDSPIYDQVMKEHPDYFARDDGGGLITVPSFPRNTLMDQGNPGWRGLHVSLVKRAMERWPFDGVFVDSMGPNALTRYTTGVPVNRSTRRAYTREEWLQESVLALDAIKAALGDRFVLFNGLVSGPAYEEGTDVLSASDADAGMAEAFVRSPSGPIDSYPSPSDWRADLEMMSDMESKGKAFFGWTKTWVPATEAERRQWNTFALATYLLGKGSRSYYAFLPDREVDRTSIFYPEMRASLGMPLGGFTESGGIFTRMFERGTVSVDPGRRSASIRVSG